MAKKSIINTEKENDFLDELKKIIQQARQKTYAVINFAQVEANWLIGRRIVEQEQNRKSRAEYGKYIDLELVVTVYNINHGRNPDLEKQSKTLADYALLIAKIREYETAGLGLENALKRQ
ncbi:hypothetical protein AGMMS50230_06980 [Spirochaetia bacterium]|nr:hypothetical protein AGMMS50230_06980 [Spirochaetia bacterium]